MGQLRQLTITDLGAHEVWTILLTNQYWRSPSDLIGRYAQRKNADREQHRGWDRFFHMDALSRLWR